MRSALHAADVPPDLILEFVATFSRFEFALKDAGFIYCSKSRAMPDWVGLSKNMAVALDADLGLQAVIKQLVDDPPMVQACRNGKLTWEPPSFESESPAANALNSARIVRNNLFHGGKHTPHSPPGRDAKLIGASLTLLRGCLALNRNLREAFEQDASA